MRLSYSGQVCLPSKEDTVSSNLISRSSGQQTRKGFVAIQKNSPFFLPRYLMVGYLGFYFTKALRTVLISTMRTTLSRVVTSSLAVASMCVGIPTGVSHSLDLFGDSSKDGWRVASSGSVGSLGDHYVYDSYG